jgi:hypothetical protein
MEMLYELGGELFARHPWTLLADDELVLVEGASGGELCFCSFLGALGQVLSLHAYLGPDGYRLFKRLHSGKPITVGEFLATGRCVFVEFVTLRELTPPDRALLKVMGHPLKRGARAPIFRSIRPGYHPWYVTEGEARVLAECVRAMLVFWDVFLDSDVEYWEEENVYPLLVPHAEEGKEHPYEIQMVKAPLPPTAMPEPPALDEARIEQIRKSEFPSRGTLEVDHFYGAGMVGKENERKACSRLAVAIEGATAFAYPPVVASPETSTGTMLTDVVFQAIESAGALPLEIRVRCREFKTLLDPLADLLGFSVTVSKSLPALEFAKSHLLKAMGDPGPFSGELPVDDGH